MNVAETYLVSIGTGSIKSGTLTGNVIINFDKNGGFLVFTDNMISVQFKKISKMTFSEEPKQKVKKGSSVAKFLQFSTSMNKDIKGDQRIAAVMAYQNFAADKVVIESNWYCYVDFENSNAKFAINPEDKDRISLAFNNPKVFFEKSISEGWCKKVFKTGAFKYFLIILIPFLGLLIIAHALVIINKSKNSAERKKWSFFSKTDEYQNILKEL